MTHKSEQYRIDVTSETELNQQWTFDIEVLSIKGSERPIRFEVLLSWVDYDHWCHGRIPPERVAKAVMAYVLGQTEPALLKKRFDCASMRRRYPDLDEKLPHLLAIRPNL